MLNGGSTGPGRAGHIGSLFRSAPWLDGVSKVCPRPVCALRYVLRGHPMLLKIEHACKLSNCDVSQFLDPVAPEQGETADKWEAVYVPFKDTKKKTRTEIKIHAAHIAASLGSTSVLQWLVDHCSPDVLCYQSILGTVCEDSGATFEPGTNGKFEADCREHYTPLLAALFMSSLVAGDKTCPSAMVNFGWRMCHTLVEKKAGLLTTVKGLESRQDGAVPVVTTWGAAWGGSPGWRPVAGPIRPDDSQQNSAGNRRGTKVFVPRMWCPAPADQIGISS
eukprot:Skav203766  [mRNA]  locus=scaffold206:80319:84037:+ [translate_table: standard]